MNAHAVAVELGLNERTVRRAIADHFLAAQKVGREWEIDLDDARALFVNGRRTGADPYQEALAEALRLLRAFNHEADAVDLEDRYGLVYTEPTPKVRVA